MRHHRKPLSREWVVRWYEDEVFDGTLWRCTPSPSRRSSTVAPSQGAGARLHDGGVGGGHRPDRSRLLRGARRAGRHHRLGGVVAGGSALQRRQHEHLAHRAGLAQRPGRQRPAVVDPQASARRRFRRRRLQHQHADSGAHRRRPEGRRLFDPPRRLGALQRRSRIQPHQDQRGVRAHQAIRRAEAGQPGRREPKGTRDAGPRTTSPRSTWPVSTTWPKPWAGSRCA